MFFICVIAFSAGIYTQAICQVPLFICILGAALCLTTALPLIHYNRRWAAVIMLASFAFAGMTRIGFNASNTPYIEKHESSIHEGIVTESSPHTKIIKLTGNTNLRGIRTVYRTKEKLGISDRVRIYGIIRMLPQTFKNPYINSWKWVRGLDGIRYELRGSTISIKEGNNLVETWRRFLGEKIDQSGAHYASVIKALVIGDTSGIDNRTKNLFLHTGTSHLLAISGSNMAIATGFFYLIVRVFMRISLALRQRGDDKKYAALFTIPFAVFFMLTAGSDIPVIRATIMVIIYMIAIFLDRGKQTENIVALSALVILTIYPYSLFMPSFQLTFISVLSIILFIKTIYSRVLRWPSIARWIFSSFFVTIFAMVGTLPIVLYHFYGFNPLGFIHNFITVPIVSLIAMPLSLTGLFLPFGGCILRLSGEILSIIIAVLKYLDFGYMHPLPRPNLFETVAYFVFVLSLFFYQKKLIRFFLFFLLVPVFSLYICYSIEGRFYNKTLCFNFIDVGLGDAILIEAPQGVRMLLDGGGIHIGDFDMGKTIIMPILLSKKILSLDAVINTHPHTDHLDGLFYIINNMPVGQFVLGKAFQNNASYVPLFKRLRANGIPISYWKRGDKFTLPNGVDIDVRHPSSVTSIENPNNASLVLNFSHGKNSFLLTGDIDASVEDELVLLDQVQRANVLKIPHHGSRFSNSITFLEAVKPDIAIMSTGRGIKGVPSEKTVELYRQLAIPVLRTDLNGLVRVCSNGESISCRSYVESVPGYSQVFP